MGADEIIEWMAFLRTENPEYMEALRSQPVAYSAEEEGNAVLSMFKRLKKTP